MRNLYPIHVFSWVLLNLRTTEPTNQPTTDHLPTDQPTQLLTESIIIFGRLDNSNIFILQNTSTAEKTYKETRITFLKHYFFNDFVCWGYFHTKQLYLHIQEFSRSMTKVLHGKRVASSVCSKSPTFTERNSRHTFADVCKNSTCTRFSI